MIYVDMPKTYNTPLRYKMWSHMWSDTSDDELHAMADKLGLKRSWFQEYKSRYALENQREWYNHYDVTPRKRNLALKLGAVPMEIADFIESRLSRG